MYSSLQQTSPKWPELNAREPVVFASIQVSDVHNSWKFLPPGQSQGKIIKRTPWCHQPVWGASHQAYREIENWVFLLPWPSLPGYEHVSEVCYREQRPQFWNKETTQEFFDGKKTHRGVQFIRESIFRWQEEQSILSCTLATSNQEFRQTKAYRMASAHSSGLRILAEVGWQIAKLSLERLCQGTT